MTWAFRGLSIYCGIDLVVLWFMYTLDITPGRVITTWNTSLLDNALIKPNSQVTSA